MTEAKMNTSDGAEDLRRKDDDEDDAGNDAGGSPVLMLARDDARPSLYSRVIRMIGLGGPSRAEAERRAEERRIVEEDEERRRKAQAESAAARPAAAAPVAASPSVPGSRRAVTSAADRLKTSAARQGAAAPGGMSNPAGWAAGTVQAQEAALERKKAQGKELGLSL